MVSVITGRKQAYFIWYCRCHGKCKNYCQFKPVCTCSWCAL